jgi:hypothetical protein
MNEQDQAHLPHFDREQTGINLRDLYELLNHIGPSPAVTSDEPVNEDTRF